MQNKVKLSSHETWMTFLYLGGKNEHKGRNNSHSKAGWSSQRSSSHSSIEPKTTMGSFSILLHAITKILKDCSCSTSIYFPIIAVRWTLLPNHPVWGKCSFSRRTAESESISLKFFKRAPSGCTFLWKFPRVYFKS